MDARVLAGPRTWRLERAHLRLGDAANVTLRQRLAAYGDSTSEELAVEIHAVEQRIADEGRNAWPEVSSELGHLERRLAELQQQRDAH